MNFLIKVEGVEHVSQLIIIDRRKVTMIDDIDNFLRNIDVLHKYEGKEVFADYMSPSRIDGEPMFRIDTLQIERDEKISEILK